MVKNNGFEHPKYYQTNIKGLISTVFIFFGLTIFSSIAWFRSESPWYLWLFLVSIFVFMALLRPVIEKRKVCIRNGNIIVLHRIGKPLNVNIAKCLYEIVVEGEDIKNFRFRTERRRIQVSPQGYIDGDELMKEIKDVIKREKITARIVER
jgi:hypothetical protein